MSSAFATSAEQSQAVANNIRANGIELLNVAPCPIAGKVLDKKGGPGPLPGPGAQGNDSHGRATPRKALCRAAAEN